MIEIARCNALDHDRMVTLIKGFDHTILSDPAHMAVMAKSLFVCESEEKCQTVLELMIINLAAHLDWALTVVSREDYIVDTIELISTLSRIEEAEIAMEASESFSIAIFSALIKSLSSTSHFDTLIRLLNKQFFTAKTCAIERIIDLLFMRLNALDLPAVVMLNKLFLKHSFLQKRFMEHPEAVNLVSKLIWQLEISTETLHIIQISSLIILLTKERELLEEDTASRILKLASTSLESSDHLPLVEACCTFLTVSCIKPVLALRLRRNLMSGLLRKLFSKNSKGIIVCVAELLIKIFETKLLTPDFIPQHSIPLDMLLRWLNGHSLESWRSARLLSAMKMAGFFPDEESCFVIFEELKCVVDIYDVGRSHQIGSTMKILKICLPTEYLSLVRILGFEYHFGPIPEIRLETTATFEGFYLAHVALFERHHHYDVDCHSLLMELYDRDLILGIPSIILTTDDRFKQFALRVSKRLQQRRLEMLERINFLAGQKLGNILVEQTQIPETNLIPNNPHFYETKMAELKHLYDGMTQNCEELSRQLSEKDNTILNLQHNLSTESKKVLGACETIVKFRDEIMKLNVDLCCLRQAIKEYCEPFRVESFLAQVAAEMESFKIVSLDLTNRLSRSRRQISDLEDKIVITGEETKLLAQSNTDLTGKLQCLKAQAEEQKQMYLAQLKQLEGRQFDLESKHRDLQNLYHAAKEELMSLQLREGQSKLELQSLKALSDMKEQQVATLKEQISDMSTQLALKHT